MGLQILFGSALLIGCALIHVLTLAASLPLFDQLSQRIPPHHTRRRVAILLCSGVFVIVVAHTLQIWTWAVVFFASGIFTDFAASFYFATVTYTTLGYGDLVLGEHLRIFGTFAAITGLLTFGISTAILIGLVVRLMPDVFADRR